MAKKTDVTADNAKKAGEPAEVVSYWLNEIGAARKREKDYRKEGARILEIYEGRMPEKIPFNILYSNTETMLPALYSATPRPVVQRRFKDDDPLGKAAATAGQRILEFLIDTNIEGYETVDAGMKAATLDGLLPGRGVTSVKYDFEEGEMQAQAGAEEEGQEEEEPTPYKKSELVCVNSRSWNRVFFGYSRKWSKVPWIAYEEHIDKEEATRLFGKGIADKIIYTTGDDADNDEDREQGTDADDRNTGERKTALVYQIWDKAGGRKVRYISAQYTDGFLDVKDDPLELTGFFDCPEPLQFMDKVNNLVPVALYCLYENQAKELNRLTGRINRIVEALKARGVYDTELGEDIANLMKADDNALVPADKASSLAAEKGLQNAIWFMPLEVLIGVLEKLYVAREQCKAVIYEITGISDIIRGSTVASETASAQKLKSEWGTLRLKPKQKEVQRYARDILRMMLEIAASKFSEETWAKMTGLPFLLEPKFNELTAVATALKEKVAQEQMQASLAPVQMPPQGAASPPPPPPSQSQQQLQQVLGQLQAPKWSDVLAMLRDDMQRSYRIDIETNSTVAPEAVEDQKNISEVMTALGQFLNGVTPLVTSGAMPFQAAQSMMMAIVRRFRFGTEIEDYVKQMQPPKPPDDGKAAAAAKDAVAMKEQQLQKDAKAMQDRIASDARVSQLETALKAADEENKLIARKAELDVRELKVQVAEDRLKISEERAVEKISTKEQVSQVKNSADQKVRSLQEAGAKREQQVAKASTDGSTQIAKTVEQIVQLQAQLLQSVSEQSEKNQELMQNVIKAVTAPRRSKAIRGKDGKISETVSEIAA